MSTVRDKLWLWGQSPDSHYVPDSRYGLLGYEYHFPGELQHYGIPSRSRMSTVEGCLWLGVPNSFRVKMRGHPVPPFDREAIAMDSLKRTAWSITGAGGDLDGEWGAADEIARVARLHPNVAGGIFDDFAGPKRLEFYTPARLREIRRRMCDGAGRNLDMMAVYYYGQCDGGVGFAPWIAELDVVTLWSMQQDIIRDVDRHLDNMLRLTGGRRVFAGCYLWGYAPSKEPVDEELLKYELAVYLDYMKRGKLDGIIFCANVVCDIGLRVPELARQWIRDNGDVELGR